MMNNEYKRGLDDAWKAAYELVELAYGEAHDVYDILPVLKKYTPEEAMKQVKQEKLKVGDEIEWCQSHAVVTNIDSGTVHAMYKSGNVFKINKDAALRHRTGKHYKEMIELLKAMNGGWYEQND